MLVRALVVRPGSGEMHSDFLIGPPGIRCVVHQVEMLRRLVAVVVLAGVCVGLGLPLLRAARGEKPASTGAVKLVSASGKRLSGQWQSWADASLVPTVAGKV